MGASRQVAYTYELLRPQMFQEVYLYFHNTYTANTH